MQKLKVKLPVRKLIFPTYSKDKIEVKSCFINHNRIDTIKRSIAISDKERRDNIG